MPNERKKIIFANFDKASFFSFLLLRCCYISYRYFKGWLNNKKAFIRIFCCDPKIHFIPLTSKLQLRLGIIFKASNISFGFSKNACVRNGRHMQQHEYTRERERSREERNLDREKDIYKYIHRERERRREKEKER